MSVQGTRVYCMVSLTLSECQCTWQWQIEPQLQLLHAQRLTLGQWLQLWQVTDQRQTCRGKRPQIAQHATLTAQKHHEPLAPPLMTAYSRTNTLYSVLFGNRVFRHLAFLRLASTTRSWRRIRLMGGKYAVYTLYCHVYVVYDHQ